MSSTPWDLIKNNAPVSFELPFASPLDLLEKWAAKDPKKPALIFDDYSDLPNQAITYQELSIYVKQTIAYLRQFCPEAGQSLAFCFPNTPEVIVLNYAAWSAGLISVPLDSTRDTLDTKIYKLQKAKARVLFTRADAVSQKENQQIKQAISDLEIVELATVDDFLQQIGAADNSSQDNQLTPTADETCLILYTSGTTALPKAAQLTSQSLFANAASIADWLAFDEKDRWLVVLPLHHINSSTFVNTTFLAGGTVILVPQYSKSNFWRVMAKHGCTGTSIVPTIAYDLVGESESFQQFKENLSQIRRIQLGSAPVQPTVVKKFVDLYGIRLCQGYGQTETSLRSTGVPLDLSDDQYQQIVELNSLGTELKFTNATVLDERGAEVAANQEGEICVRGPIIMKGYLDNPEANAEAFAFDWFHSGDTGFWQELFGRRFFFLKGRTKEIIKKGGVLISPLAIENALLKAYPELKMLYVVGFPDLRLGDEIGFVAVSDNSLLVEQILADCKSGKFQALKPFERPVAGLLITESDLPTTSTGKVQRVKIRELFGSQLLEQSRIIAKTEHHLFRLIGPEEKTVLEQALAINNQRWGEHLAATLDEFASRAEHGVVIGMFEGEKLIGSVCGLTLDSTELEKPWTQTWDGITDNGLFTTSQHKADAAVMVSISVQSSQDRVQVDPLTKEEEVKLEEPAVKQQIEDYLNELKDPVLAFHHQAKAGMKVGADLVKILANARPKDVEALGYCALMKYPSLASVEPSIDQNASYGVQLLEAAFVWAKARGLEHVFAYSRPSGLRSWLQTQ